MTWRPASGRPTPCGSTDLERDANLVALGHVFPRGRHPFPDADVRARGGPGARRRRRGRGHGRRRRLVAFLAHDGTVTLRHLAVHPDGWGRGLGRAAVERAVAAGATRLWCLVDNQRARGLYEHLGWRPTGAATRASGRRTRSRSSTPGHPRIPGMADDLLGIADDLYALPLGDFTPARDARAKELKGTDLAAPVKALKKPSLAAWVVNLLVRRDAEQADPGARPRRGPA